MKKAGLILIILLPLTIIAVWWINRTIKITHTQDAVQVIAYAASEMFENNPATTQDEIDRMINHHHEASNINLRIDPTGKAVDPFGTAFRIHFRIEESLLVTTVTSAGPDHRFGTEDDIQFVNEEKI